MPDATKKPTAILLTQYVVGQHGSGSFLQDVVVPVARIVRVENATTRNPKTGEPFVAPPNFAASYRSRLHLKAPEDYMFATEDHVTIMRWMNEGQSTTVTTHGTSADCPDVKAGRWEYCKGHRMPERE